MSLLLVNPPCLYASWDVEPGRRLSYLEVLRRHSGSVESWRTFPTEILPLMSIQAYCATRGLRVSVVNAVTSLHRDVHETLASIKAVAAGQGAPQLIGFTGTNLVFEENLWLAEQCKRLWPGARTVLGHDFATLNYRRVLQEHPIVDFACLGDGEVVFAELARRILDALPYDDVPGLAFRDEAGRARANPPQAVDLDSLPWVSREDLRTVKEMGLCASVYTTRGCPYRCTFCSTGETANLFGKERYRLRSIEDVVEEMSCLRRDHGVEHVTITDDLFVTRSEASRDRAERFARALIDANLGISFMIDCRVDSIEEGLFRLLHKAGLRRVFVGVETGSAEQLVRYRKKYPRALGDPAAPLAKLRDLGVQIVPGILTYHPRVTAAELLASLRMIDTCGFDGMYQFLNRVKPYPGTPLYDEYDRDGLLTARWPVADWEFEDPRADALHRAVTAAARRPGSTFAEVRAVFQAKIEAWGAPCPHARQHEERV